MFTCDCDPPTLPTTVTLDDMPALVPSPRRQEPKPISPIDDWETYNLGSVLLAVDREAGRTQLTAVDDPDAEALAVCLALIDALGMELYEDDEAEPFYYMDEKGVVWTTRYGYSRKECFDE